MVDAMVCKVALMLPETPPDEANRQKIGGLLGVFRRTLLPASLDVTSDAGDWLRSFDLRHSIRYPYQIYSAPWE
jgi:hypothetical protein